MTSRQTFIIVRTVSNSLLIGSVLYLFLAFGPIVSAELSYSFRQWRGVTYSLEKGVAAPKFSPFASLIGQPTPLRVTPVNRGFSIVIEKLGVNAPVVKNVNVADYKEYINSLRYGVAHAAGTPIPSVQPGNTYLFAHSALDFWNFGKYAMVFTLLNKLGNGDRLVLFYEGQRYDYQVFNKEVVKDFDTKPLGRTYDEPVLTLQTCDPPGTALNRLIVTARLVR
jgi:LPXTG-site transpeptidase (sortase) family protein